jgi:carbon monoxide dehydrogenase subunit G
VPSRYDVSYSGSFDLDAEPEELWAALKRVDLFPMWWPWIKEVELQGEALAVGSAITFTIDPPIPHKLHVRVDVIESTENEFLLGDVSGDLKGTGSLAFDGFPGVTEATTEWIVEVSNPAIRAIIKIARPLLLYAQRWAVESSLRGFRRYLAERED